MDSTPFEGIEKCSLGKHWLDWQIPGKEKPAMGDSGLKGVHKELG